MGKILPGPWDEPRKEQILFPHMLGDVSQDLQIFSAETHQALQRVCTPFKSSSDINPVHCRKALNVLEPLYEKLYNADQELFRNASLAFMLSPSRYSILINLSRTQENISRLIDQIDDYRVSCLKPSHRPYPQRREITILFDKVLRLLEDIPDLITSLEREMEVQDQKLASMVKLKKHTSVPYKSSPSERNN